MGKLIDFWNSILDKITGHDRIKALPSEDEDNAKMDYVRIFKQELERLAQQSEPDQIFNGDDLITNILISLGANRDIVMHEAAKERLQTFVREILAQKNVDTRYLDRENIKKIIQEIKGIKVKEINGEEVLVYSQDPPYRIEIENGAIYLQARDDNNFGMERYCYSINEAGSLSVKATKYKKGYFGYEVSEENDIDYDNNGIEQKRRTKKMELDPETNKRTIVSEHFMRERHPIYPFLVEQNIIGSHGRKVVVPGTRFKLLNLGTLNSLETLDDSNVSFQGTPEIESFYRKNQSKIDAMLQACGIGDEKTEGR